MAPPSASRTTHHEFFNQMPNQVLIIEDDPDIVDLLSIHLRDLDCQVESTPRGDDGYRLALQGAFDLILLDLMLPRLDGADICRRLRSDGITTPILMLTARAEEVDKILGLEIGADDYLTKPFSVRELTARVKAIFRRCQYEQRQALPSSVLERGPLLIDRDKLKVTRDGQRLDLTPKELDLLVLLAGQPGRSFSRDQLLDQVWGLEFAGDSHTVNSHVNRLRRKIEPDPEQPRFILTTWGIGYRFAEEW